MTLSKTRITQALTIATALSTLAACSAEQGYGASFFKEAGSQLDSGEFGNATLHNQLVQTCNTGAGFKGKGTAPGDPVVVLDPSSTPSRKVYRVHCDGNLDGKYANVIYREYIESAVPQSTVTDADAGSSDE